jgi:hypothetical protein
MLAVLLDKRSQALFKFRGAPSLTSEDIDGLGAEALQDVPFGCSPDIFRLEVRKPSRNADKKQRQPIAREIR